MTGATKNSNNKPEFSTVQDALYSEQEFCWQRFASFAMIHAGLFVLAASEKFNNHKLLYGIALLLAVVWIYVQVLSWIYAHRLKDLYSSKREEEGLEYKYPNWAKCIIDKWPSSTTTGVATSIIVAALWILLLVNPT